MSNLTISRVCYEINLLTMNFLLRPTNMFLIISNISFLKPFLEIELS